MQMLIAYHAVLILILGLTTFLLIPLGKSLMNFILNKYSKFQVKESQQLQSKDRDSVLGPIVQELYSSNTESPFTLHEGVLFYCHCIVIFKSLQLSILQEIHETHLEITKMEQLTKKYVYWKSTDTNIERLVKSCTECTLIQKNSKKVPSIHSVNQNKIGIIYILIMLVYYTESIYLSQLMPDPSKQR